MNEAPEKNYINKIVNKTISSVSYGLNVITLGFSNGNIYFSGSFMISFKNKRFLYDEVFPVTNDFGLLELLEKRIVKVNNIDDGICFSFENECSLELYCNEYYESFTLNIEGVEFIR
jgi:hypothetical protein